MRNKFCAVCEWNKRKNQQEDSEEEKHGEDESECSAQKEHKCTKNWGTYQSSGSMESSVIVEGFTKSIEMHNLVYKVMIADGDSNTTKALIEARPYEGIVIQKVECKNHLWRNFNGHIRVLVATSNKDHPIKLRRIVGGKILRLRTRVNKCIKKRKEENISKDDQSILLKNDIVLCLRCIFGDHSKCPMKENCPHVNKDDPKNHTIDLKSSPIWMKIFAPVQRLLNNSRSLIENKDSNRVECLNSVVAKFAVNKSQLISRTYQSRVNLSVMSFNNKGRILEKVNRELFLQSPGHFTTKHENAKEKRNRPENRKQQTRRKLFASDSANKENAKHYGTAVETPVLSGADLKHACMTFVVETVNLTAAQIIKLELDTKLQAECELWLARRGYTLTASHHGRVCKKRAATPCKTIVKIIMYTNLSGIRSIEHGKSFEEAAKKALEKLLDIQINKAGLFLCCEKHPYLGASPDGLVDNDTIVELKCPFSAKDMTPEEGILAGKIKCWKIINKPKGKKIIDLNNLVLPNGQKFVPKYEFDKKHDYYYQIQSQLHYSKREKCVFAVYTLKYPHIKYEYIYKDDVFYYTKMKKKLKDFYWDCLLPEIVDPMQRRNMEIREPLCLGEKIDNKCKGDLEVLKPTEKRARDETDKTPRKLKKARKPLSNVNSL